MHGCCRGERPPMSNHRGDVRYVWAICAALSVVLAIGCAREKPSIKYLGKEKHDYYRDHATQIAYPTVDLPLPSEVSGTAPPHTIHETEVIPIRDLALMEAIQIALQN